MREVKITGPGIIDPLILTPPGPHNHNAFNGEEWFTIKVAFTSPDSANATVSPEDSTWTGADQTASSQLIPKETIILLEYQFLLTQ